VLVLGMVVCAALALWTAVTVHQAKRCLDGELRSDTHGAGITERGCEITTISGETVLIPIQGPPFEVGVAAVFGFIVLVLLLLILVTRRDRRTSSGHS
jgi:hypothetical protein